MTTQGPKDYRGGLIYRQEYGYKLVTMAVSVAPREQSHVTSYAHNLPITEEAEHIQGVDLYHFAVTDKTEIQLTMETPAGNKEAWYTVQPDDIIAQCPPLKMDIVRSDKSVPLEYAYTEVTRRSTYLLEDQISDWRRGIQEQPYSRPQ